MGKHHYEIFLSGTRELSGIKCLITNRIKYIHMTCNLDGINALIFTSPYAIYSLIESEQRNLKLRHWRDIQSFVLSSKIAHICRKNNAKVAFVASKAYGEHFAHEICPILQNQKVLYVRGKDTAFALDSVLLEANIDLQQVIAYENSPQKLDISLKPQARSVIIFGAPSAYRSFVANFGWEDEYIAIAIGETTFQAFDKGIKAYISPQPSFESCITFAKALVETL